VNFLIRAKKIPMLDLDYPSTEEEAKDFVYKISQFLKNLGSQEEKK